MYANNTGSNNTASGYLALCENTNGIDNTAEGSRALNTNTTGTYNTACGNEALYNSNGNFNTATGHRALYSDTTGAQNTAIGANSLYFNTTGSYNLASGDEALYNSTGSSNIGLGYRGGYNLTTGSNNIDIGNTGVAAESATIRLGTKAIQTNTYIAGISGVTVPGGIGVIVDSNGHLGTTTSSARFKDGIKPMDNASESILSLQPVTFRYRKELDPAGIPQFGLVAEEVAKVNPDLVVHDEEGKPYSVRYEAVNAMLLNEFLKEHRKVEKQDSDIAELRTMNVEQQKEIKALTTILKEQGAQIQRVNARLPATYPATSMASND